MNRVFITKLLLSSVFFTLIPTQGFSFSLDLFTDVSPAVGNNAGVQDKE